MSKRALIVIDVQNEYFDGGVLPITDPSPTQRSGEHRAGDGQATERGVPTVVVRHTEQDPDAGMFHEAAHRGFSVEVLSDATGTLALENSGGAATGEERHRSTLVAQGQFFADIVSTDEWLSRLDD